MAGRRRSLLDRAKPQSSHGAKDAAQEEATAPPPHATPADTVADDAPTLEDVETPAPAPAAARAPEPEPASLEPEPASPEPEPASPEPEPEPAAREPAPEPPPPAVASEAPTPVPPPGPRRPPGPYAEISGEEPRYADKSTGPVADTAPLGWDSAVHGGATADPIDDFFDTSSKPKSATPGKATPAKDPPRPVARDAGPAWSDPIGVPGPPPLPGLSDRFTPPPAERRALGSDDRPSYVATPPPAMPDPRAGRRKEITDEPPEITEPVPRPFGLPPVVFGSLVLIAVAVVIGVIVVVIRSFTGEDTTTIVTVPKPVPVAPASAPVAPGGLEVRSSLHSPGEPDTATPTTAPAPGVAPAPHAAPAPGVAPAPTAAPAPRPRPAPTAAPIPVTKTGTLRVRSNRKVLVFINGRAMGHAPLDLPLVPGSYTLSAALPSRPDTEQIKMVDLSAGESERVDFNF